MKCGTCGEIEQVTCINRISPARRTAPRSLTRRILAPASLELDHVPLRFHVVVRGHVAGRSRCGNFAKVIQFFRVRLLANFLARTVVMQHGVTKYLRRTGAVLSDVQDLQLPLQIPKTAGFVVIRRESARQDRAGRTRRGVAALTLCRIFSAPCLTARIASRQTGATPLPSRNLTAFDASAIFAAPAALSESIATC